MTNPTLIFVGYRLQGPMHPAVPEMPPHVQEICSASQCIRGLPDGSELSWDGFCGLQLHTTVEYARRVLPPEIALQLPVMAFRVLSMLFQKGNRIEPLDPRLLFGNESPAFPANPVDHFESLGFDAVSFSPFRLATKQYAACLGMLSHSPLTCNEMANEFVVNRYCLFDHIEDAINAATTFSRDEPEPGPYLVVEVLRRMPPFEQH